MAEVQRNDERVRWIRKGVGLFNAGRFWHSHEALERVWLTESGEVKEALQGVILIAAAFHHQRRGNYRGMASTLRRGYVKLRKRDRAYGIDVARLRADVERLMTMVEDEAALLASPPPRIVVEDE